METGYELLKDVELQRDAYGKLVDAITDCNYPALYACLRKEKGMYLHDQAYHLCSCAIRSGCTVKAFEAILGRCLPPLEEFVNYGSTHNHLIHTHSGSCGGLVQEAAANGQTHLLRYMLDQGCSPNARGSSDCSALEAALYHGAIGCVSLLEQRDDVDFTITETLLEI